MAIIVKTRDSLLTTSSGYTNYRGILNLVTILLVLSNARAALENIIKYGILVDPISWILFLGEASKHTPPLIILVFQGVHISVSLFIEKLLARLFKRELLQLSSSSDTPSSSSTTTTTSKTLENNNFLINNNHDDENKQLDGNLQKDTQTIKQNNQNYYKQSKLMPLVNITIAINLLATISLPPLIVYSYDTHPISTSISLMVVSIVFLKLVSYHMMNFWCRDSQRPLAAQSRTTKSFLRSYVPPAIDFCKSLKDSKQTPNGNTTTTTSNATTAASIPNGNTTTTTPNAKTTTNIKTTNPSNHHIDDNQHCQQVALETLSKYPANISSQNMIKYMSFPTLCYELEYAQTERIRKRFLIKRIVELIILSQLDMALIQQWIVPTVSNSVTPFRQMQFSHMLERLLKLAIPNHVIWLIWFYLFFHSLLNIIAELTRFADREFYRDWWNSESVSYFWSNWNIPVHKWCARHLYVPLIALGLSRRQASTAVFFVSAFFHEYLVSVPLKLFRMWAFTGMLVQLPWARFVSAYFNNHFANVAVWASLIIGQPLCILMYYHDYYVIHNKSIN